MDQGSRIKDWKSRILHLVNISLISVIIAKISFICLKSLKSLKFLVYIDWDNSNQNTLKHFITAYSGECV